jgi:hypothetical protein
MMESQVAFDFTAARARRDDGMSRAVEHADRVEPTWSDRAFNVLREYALTHAEPFLIERVVEASKATLHAPTDKRAWGAVVQRARRAELIERAGYAPAATSNCSPKPLWKRV